MPDDSSNHPERKHYRLNAEPGHIALMSGSATLSFSGHGNLVAGAAVLNGPSNEIPPNLIVGAAILSGTAKVLQPTIEIRKRPKLWDFPRLWDVLTFALPINARKGYFEDYRQELLIMHAKALGKEYDKPLMRWFINVCLVGQTIGAVVITYAAAATSGTSAMVVSLIPKEIRDAIRTEWARRFPPEL
jgi:hypothetical protein